MWQDTSKAHQAITESPKPYDDGQGWVKTDQDGLHAIWSRGSILPKSLVDLLEADQDGAERVEEDEEDQENGEINFDALLEDDKYWLWIQSIWDWVKTDFVTRMFQLNKES